MGTRAAVDPENALSTSKVPREWQSPLLFFAVVLALWGAMWCGVYLLVKAYKPPAHFDSPVSRLALRREAYAPSGGMVAFVRCDTVRRGRDVKLRGRWR